MKKVCLVVLLLSLSACAFAQQDYVGRYDVYAGYSYLNSPKLNLQQRGLNVQVGYNARRWLALGFDYSIQFGRSSIVPSDLKPQYAAAAEALVAGYGPEFGLPSNYVLWIPFDATTQTYTAGPQLNYRHFKKVTLFAHPSIGAIHENIAASDHGDPFIKEVVLPAFQAAGVLKTLRPNDTTYFYGFGGGADYNLTKHVHIRFDAEFVHTFLFSNLLATSRNSLRLSVGPTFNFGSNVTR
jgi:opacity protein-like surface antigen